ncbi:hypothetical protein [Listeria monocytogenes]|uniref:hypothetical protein n=1 Tax=Listeria monocytogenes TaxID=1639 RepID=UPI000D5E3E2D|nr:hypothetical protein [Listeria monocytogenes]PVZ64614.1 hypothetical protein DD020_08315 [Listeria monocytogenes]
MIYYIKDLKVKGKIFENLMNKEAVEGLITFLKKAEFEIYSRENYSKYNKWFEMWKSPTSSLVFWKNYSFRCHLLFVIEKDGECLGIPASVFESVLQIYLADPFAPDTKELFVEVCNLYECLADVTVVEHFEAEESAWHKLTHNETEVSKRVYSKDDDELLKYIPEFLDTIATNKKSQKYNQIQGKIQEINKEIATLYESSEDYIFTEYVSNLYRESTKLEQHSKQILKEELN